MAEPAIAVVVEASAWTDALPDAERIARAAAERALREADIEGAIELSIVLADDPAVQALNRDWRGQDRPTNVLSFPGDREPSAPGAPVLLGDVVVAYQTAAREVAAGEAASLAHHLAHLIVHGVLHLLGHDHEDDVEAETMERLETALLKELGVPDPYHERRTP